MGSGFQAEPSCFLRPINPKPEALDALTPRACVPRFSRDRQSSSDADSAVWQHGLGLMGLGFQGFRLERVEG